MINDITEMRLQVVEEFEALRKDPKRHYVTKEITNAFGKVCMSCALQVEYAAQRREKPEIAFLGKCGTALPAPSAKVLNAKPGA